MPMVRHESQNQCGWLEGAKKWQRYPKSGNFTCDDLQLTIGIDLQNNGYIGHFPSFRLHSSVTDGAI
ncbi:hypothetical protein NIES4075_70500 [Tolypothrix sp. NIES-4075]|nr:hypothetical protein NIES4075_70500 [Tolypothrix sp. NIES-4075]